MRLSYILYLFVCGISFILGIFLFALDINNLDRITLKYLSLFTLLGFILVCVIIQCIMVNRKIDAYLKKLPDSNLFGRFLGCPKCTGFWFGLFGSLITGIFLFNLYWFQTIFYMMIMIPLCSLFNLFLYKKFVSRLEGRIFRKC